MILGATYFQSVLAELPEGFVYLADVIPSIHVDLHYASETNFVGVRVDGYNGTRAILTRQAAEALSGVQMELGDSVLGLKVFDSYRPQRAVNHFIRWASGTDDKATKAQYYPDVDKDQLISSGYIAEKSRHSRGSTLDLTIVSLASDSREELDMGTQFDYFGPESWPDSDAVTPSQKANRMMLQSLMGRYGF